MIPKDGGNSSSIIPIEYRCGCGKLLFKGFIISSEFEIKCKNCHAINFIGRSYDGPPSNLPYSILFKFNADIVDASPSATEILGYTKEELLLKKIQEIYPLLKISTYTNLSKILTFLEAEPFIWDTLCQKKNGEFISVRTHLRYTKDPRGTNTLAILECAQHPEKPVSHSPVHSNPCNFISKINTEGAYTYVSVKLATLLGYPSIEMLGKSIFDFHPDTEQEKIKELFFQNTASKESFKIPSHLLSCSNKDTLHFESYFAADHNDRGQLKGFQILSWLIP